MPKRRRHAVHGGIDESYWNGLDNAAKLMPAVTNTRTTNVFRLCAMLKEDVEPAILQRAVEKALRIMPSFALKLHRGLFWYYFDANHEKPVVREETGYPCAPIYRGRENGYLFRVLYYRKRISFEIFHALSDGMGATNFLTLIVYCYYNIKLGDSEVPEEYIRREMDRITRDFDEDSFKMAPSCENRQKKEPEPEAFHLSGYRYDGERLGVLTALIPTDELLQLARSKGVTLSEYLSALLIWSIYNTSYRRSGRQHPIVINIPVNLRGMFDSITLRNFFGQMFVSVLPQKGDAFEDMLEKTVTAFKNQLTKEYFEQQISGRVAIERIPGIKFVPLFIKNAVMKILFKRAARLYTCTFSNLGRLQLPPMIADHVERAELCIGASETHPKKLGLISCGNQMAITFTSTIDDTSLEQFMFSFLADQGIDVSVSSNDVPAPAKKKPKKEKSK